MKFVQLLRKEFTYFTAFEIEFSNFILLMIFEISEISKCNKNILSKFQVRLCMSNEFSLSRVEREIWCWLCDIFCIFGVFFWLSRYYYYHVRFGLSFLMIVFAIFSDSMRFQRIRRIFFWFHSESSSSLFSFQLIFLPFHLLVTCHHYYSSSLSSANSRAHSFFFFFPHLSTFSTFSYNSSRHFTLLLCECYQSDRWKERSTESKRLFNCSESCVNEKKTLYEIICSYLLRIQNLLMWTLG